MTARGVGRSAHARASLETIVPGLDLLWRSTLGDPEIRIAILDGPVDLSHSCFASAGIVVDETIAPNTVDLQGARHGTHIASVIFGAHGSAVCGIAPESTGLIIPLYRFDRDRLTPCTQIDLAQAIIRAVELGASVINVSGGEYVESREGAHPLLVDAVRLCEQERVLIVAAAGNEGCRCLHLPAAFPPVLSVGAMGRTGSPLRFSNWGSAYRLNGILAPGRDIPGAWPGERVEPQSGTSFAAPVVTGIIALLLARQKQLATSPDPYAIRELLISTAVGCDEQPFEDCSRLLAGRLDVIGAYTHLKKGEGTAMSEQFTASAAGIEDFQLPAIDTHDEVAGAATSIAFGVTPSSGLSTLTSGSPSVSGTAGGRIMPSGGCGCGGSDKTTCSCSSKKGGEAAEEKPKRSVQRVYMLGHIGYDLRSESRRDSLAQHTGINVGDPQEMLAYMEKDPTIAATIMWTLNIDSTPVYALHPTGPFAIHVYERLREFLGAQIREGVERVSIPGTIAGTTSLISGMQVPVIVPELRGMYSWTTASLVSALTGDNAKKGVDRRIADGITNFLERIYFELRNLGITSEDRAMNYAATNAFQLGSIFQEVVQGDLYLDKIEVERSPICKPGADCWDVKLNFFNPLRRLEQARTIYRFTVDVGDVVPVSVGKPRKWQVY